MLCRVVRKVGRLKQGGSRVILGSGSQNPGWGPPAAVTTVGSSTSPPPGWASCRPPWWSWPPARGCSRTRPGPGRSPGSRAPAGRRPGPGSRSPPSRSESSKLEHKHIQNIKYSGTWYSSLAWSKDQSAFGKHLGFFLEKVAKQSSNKRAFQHLCPLFRAFVASLSDLRITPVKKKGFCCPWSKRKVIFFFGEGGSPVCFITVLLLLLEKEEEKYLAPVSLS